MFQIISRRKSKQSFFGFLKNCFIYKYVRKFGLWVTPRISKNKGIFLIFVDFVMGPNKSQYKGIRVLVFRDSVSPYLSKAMFANCLITRHLIRHLLNKTLDKTVITINVNPYP